jgi:hypothetical protein
MHLVADHPPAAKRNWQDEPEAVIQSKHETML